MEAQDLNNSLNKLVTILNDAGVTFHLTGGLASSYYGEPRFTQDIDIVIALEAGPPLSAFLTKLSSGFVFDPQAVKNAVREKRMFQALDEETVIKVDFHIGGTVPGEFDRSEVVEFLPGLQLPLVSREDSILSKLLWIKTGSAKSRQDVGMMLIDPKVRVEFLEKMASKMDLLEILQELRLVYLQ